MAIIGKLRQRSALMIGVLALALGAFVLGDGLKNGCGQDQGPESFAKVNGEDISYQKFELLYARELKSYEERPNSPPMDDNTRNQFREQVWQEILQEKILNPEYEKLGLTLHDDEQNDILFGNWVHPMIYQYFRDPNTGNVYDWIKNPETGQLDGAMVLQYYNNMKSRIKSNPEDKANTLKHIALFEYFVNQVLKAQVATKYNNLIKYGFYTTNFEAKKSFEVKNTIANLSFVTKYYNEIADTTITVDDSEIAAYYENNKHDYKQKEEQRSIEYLFYDIFPSSADTANVVKWSNEAAENFAKIEDKEDEIPYFINRECDPELMLQYRYYKKEELTSAIDSVMFANKTGFVYGPYFEDGAYKVARLLDKESRPDSLKLKHLLIGHTESRGATELITRTKEEAQILRDSLLNVIRLQPDKFTEMASSFSDGPYRSIGGTTDWFRLEDYGIGQQPNIFSQLNQLDSLCLIGNAGNYYPVETSLGFHLLYIEDKTKLIEKVKVGLVGRKITFSNETKNNVFKNASNFTVNNITLDSLRKTVIDKGMSPRYANDITKNQKYISGVETPREIIQWTFKANKGEVSDVFEQPDKFVIVAVSSVKEAGYKPLEDVKEEITALVKQDKKADQLIEEFNSVGASSINELAQNLKLQIDTSRNVKFDANSAEKIGYDKEFIGKIFSVDEGVLSPPTKGERGVYVYIIDMLMEAPELEDYSSHKPRITQGKAYRVDNEVFNALKENVEIVDNRILYF